MSERFEELKKRVYEGVLLYILEGGPKTDEELKEIAKTEWEIRERQNSDLRYALTRMYGSLEDPEGILCISLRGRVRQHHIRKRLTGRAKRHKEKILEELSTPAGKELVLSDPLARKLKERLMA